MSALGSVAGKSYRQGPQQSVLGNSEVMEAHHSQPVLRRAGYIANLARKPSSERWQAPLIDPASVAPRH